MYYLCPQLPHKQPLIDILQHPHHACASHATHMKPVEKKHIHSIN